MGMYSHPWCSTLLNLTNLKEELDNASDPNDHRGDPAVYDGIEIEPMLSHINPLIDQLEEYCDVSFRR